MSEPRPKTAFGQDLFAQRKAAGLTQKQVAEALGYAENTIARWERGSMAPHVLVQRMVLNYLKRAGAPSE